MCCVGGGGFYDYKYAWQSYYDKRAAIDDGFVEGVMTHLGVIDKITAIGSWSMKRDYKYDFVAQKWRKILSSRLEYDEIFAPLAR